MIKNNNMKHVISTIYHRVVAWCKPSWESVVNGMQPFDESEEELLEYLKEIRGNNASDIVKSTHDSEAL